MSGDSGYDTSRYQTVQVSFLLCRKLIILEVVNLFSINTQKLFNHMFYIFTTERG